MNRLCAVVAAFVLCCSGVHAQFTNDGMLLSEIQPSRLAISTEQTTNIVFPYSIKSVDRGNGWVLAQKAKGVENILQLKAGKAAFTQTNVTVICADGQLYSFVLEYAPVASNLNVRVEKPCQSAQTSVQFADQPMGIDHYLEKDSTLRKLPAFLRMHKRSQKMYLHLKGIFLSDQEQWFCIRLYNGSMMDYQPEIRFFIKDRKRTKRSAVQEKEIFPQYETMEKSIRGQQCKTIAFAFRPFVFSSKQVLLLKVAEPGGGRQLTLRIKARQLLKARKIA